MRRSIHITSLFCLSVAFVLLFTTAEATKPLPFPPASAPAAGCFPVTKPVNRSDEENVDLIKKNLHNGCKPPKNWVPFSGGRFGVYKGTSSTKTMIEKASSDCPPTGTKTVTLKCGGRVYPACTARPGGRSGGGGQDVCKDKGMGAPTGGIALTPIPMTTNPFGNDFFACLQKLLSGFDGGTGGLGDGLVGEGGVSGGCAHGSISFCGLSAAGEICTDDEDGDGKNDVKLHGPLTITLTIDAINWVWLTTGGTITMPDGTTITVPPGGKVTLTSGGVQVDGGAVIPLVPADGKVTVSFDDEAKIHDDVVKGGTLH